MRIPTLCEMFREQRSKENHKPPLIGKIVQQWKHSYTTDEDERSVLHYLYSNLAIASKFEDRHIL